MTAVVVGALVVLVGALLCFRGYATVRVVLGAWGALVGFSVGAVLVATLADEPLLSSVAGWVVAVVLALVFAALAYAYYALSVVVGLGGAAYVVVTGLLQAAGVSPGAPVVVVGAVAAVAVAVVALAVGLPRLLLVVLTAGAGATAMVVGVRVLAGQLTVDDLAAVGPGAPGLDAAVGSPWWWVALTVVLTVAGVLTQLRLRRTAPALREDWAAPRRPVGSRP